MSDYPEHDKMAEHRAGLDTLGEFLEWLQSQRLHLMTWREDLTDERMTDPMCVKWGDHLPRECKDIPDGTRDDDLPMVKAKRHCAHWLDVTRPGDAASTQGICCLCGRGRFYEVTGIRSWVEDGRSIPGLLAAFFGIDQGKIEAEKREMLRRSRELSA
jgi:hypothetical protein